MLFPAVALTPLMGEVASFVAGGAVGAMLLRRRQTRVPSDSRGRVRTGRLPLPTPVASLTPSDEPALDAVNSFVDYLAQLPATEWLDVGRRIMAASAEVERTAAAYAILDATIGAEQLGVAAWYVRDAVETSAFVVAAPVARWTREQRRTFAAAHAAAEDAALALLAREHLPPPEFHDLYTRFDINGAHSPRPETQYN